MFEQGDRTITRAFGGLGLGLAIAKAIVDLHHGHITATSPGEGRGSVFTVELPVVPTPHHMPSAPSPVETPAPVRGLRILLVEDHQPTAKVVRRLLERQGHTLTVAGDLASARKATASQTFDLILSDLGLPDGSGTELMQELRGKTHGIAMSGFGMHEDITRSLEAGFDRHLIKPITAEQLEYAIVAVMQHARKETQGRP